MRDPVDVIAQELQTIYGIDGPIQERSRYRARQILAALTAEGYPPIQPPNGKVSLCKRSS